MIMRIIREKQSRQVMLNTKTDKEIIRKISSDNIADVIALMKRDFSIHNSAQEAKLLLQKAGIVDHNGKLANIYR